MFDALKEKYREEGRQEIWGLFVEKFGELHDEYYSQGDRVAADLVVDLIAWVQGDEEGTSDRFHLQ